MAAPLVEMTAAQVAEKAQVGQAEKALKQGPSKFDQALKANSPESVQASQGPAQVELAQRAERVQQSTAVEKTRPAEVKPYFNNADGRTNVTDPVTQKGEVSKTTSTISGLLTNIEQGQAQLDRLINGGLAGQNFSNTELLALQAGMYKYSQEMELTSKVVEKATNGLKDTLKTQV